MLPRALLVAFLTVTSVASTSGNVTWKSLRIGGGGYVTGTFYSSPLSSSSSEPQMYMKTDVGGAYRRAPYPSRPEGVQWVPLLDWLSGDQSEFYSVSHLAVDPFSGTTLYAFLGEYLNWSPCQVMKSTNAGTTWTTLVHSSNWTLGCGGNVGDRGVGDRLAIHPALNGTLMIAGYDGRVYVTQDGFASGVVGVANISLPGRAYPIPSSQPVRSVAFMPLQAVTKPGRATSNHQSGQAFAAAAASAAAAPITYAAVASAPGAGVWLSVGPNYADPATWYYSNGTAGALGNTSRLLVDPSGPYVYYTTEGGFGRLSWASSSSSGDSNPVLKVDWHVSPDGHTYGGVALHPNRPDDVTFASIGDDSSTTLRRTIDGGATWFMVNWTTVGTVPWSYNNSYDLKLNALSTLSYDQNAVNTSVGSIIDWTVLEGAMGVVLGSTCGL